MTESGGATGYHVICMSVRGGSSTVLTAELDWSEAQAALRSINQLFADAYAVAEGWTTEPVADGFLVAKGGYEVSFVVAAAHAADLTGRPQLRAEHEREDPQSLRGAG